MLHCISRVKVSDSDLPYTHLVTATIHLLYLQFEDLSLVVDFVSRVSGNLLITRAKDMAAAEYHVVTVEDIPMTERKTWLQSRHLRIWPMPGRPVLSVYSGVSSALHMMLERSRQCRACGYSRVWGMSW